VFAVALSFLSNVEGFKGAFGSPIYVSQQQAVYNQRDKEAAERLSGEKNTLNNQLYELVNVTVPRYQQNISRLQSQIFSNNTDYNTTCLGKKTNKTLNCSNVQSKIKTLTEQLQNEQSNLNQANSQITSVNNKIRKM